MATLNDRVFDNGLTVLDTEANAVYITDSEATDYTDATAPRCRLAHLLTVQVVVVK